MSDGAGRLLGWGSQRAAPNLQTAHAAVGCDLLIEIKRPPAENVCS